MRKLNREEEKKLLAELIKNHGGNKVCDIGCGDGAMTDYLNKNGLFACGFDIKIENPLSDMLVVSSAKKPAIKTNFFDSFLFKQSMHHIEKEYQQPLIELLLNEKGKKIFIVEATIGEGTYDKVKSLFFPERDMRLSVLETLHKIRNRFVVKKIETYGKIIQYDNLQNFIEENIKPNPKTVWNKEIEKTVNSIFSAYGGNFYQQMDVYLVSLKG